MAATECTFTYLAPLEGVDFSECRLFCDEFEIRKFSHAELEALFGNAIRRAFFGPDYVVDSDRLDDYWFVYVKATAPFIRWDEEPLFDLRVQVTYSNFRRPVEEALRRLALFNWHKVERFREPETVTELSPDLSILDTEQEWDPETGDEAGSKPAVWLQCDEAETKHLEETMRQARHLLSGVDRFGNEAAFVRVAMGFLLKACSAHGIEQLIWNIAAIEGAVGGMPVEETLRRRVFRIFGRLDEERGRTRETLTQLYGSDPIWCMRR